MFVTAWSFVCYFRQIGDMVHQMIASVSISPVTGGNAKTAKFVKSQEEDWSRLNWSTTKAINHGVQQALNAGPLLGYPVKYFSTISDLLNICNSCMP